MSKVSPTNALILQAAFESFQSLIVFQTTEPLWTNIEDWVQDIVEVKLDGA